MSDSSQLPSKRTGEQGENAGNRRSTRVRMTAEVTTSHVPTAPTKPELKPFTYASMLTTIQPGKLASAINGLNESTQIMDLYAVISETSITRNNVEVKLRVWRKARHLTMDYAYQCYDHIFNGKALLGSTFSEAIRAALTFHKLTEEAKQAQLPLLAVEASQKLLDYLMLVYLKDREHLLHDLLPDHRAWFEDATSFISQSTDTLSPQAQAEGYKGESVHLNEMKENVERSILPATQQVPLWDEIAAPEDIKADLWCSIMLPAIYSSVSQRRLQAILLHGAPGNGKTRLVQAISRLADIPLFHIDPTHVFQKYQEESEKHLKAIFTSALTRAPCIIFIDQIDHLTRDREGSTETNSSMNLKTLFLAELDRLADRDASCAPLYVVGATNLPWAIDDAFLRRFNQRYHVPPPDRNATYKLLRLALKPISHSATNNELTELAGTLRGFSGSDIFVGVSKARRLLVREVFYIKWWVEQTQEDGTHVFIPSAPNVQGAVRRHISSIPANAFLTRQMTYQDLKLAFRSVRSSGNSSEVFKHLKWAQENGTEN